MNNTTWEINGLTFELDLDDALDMERYENAFKRLQEKAETLRKNADSASTKIKNTCTAYRNLIDDVFGDGTSAKIIPPDCWKLRNHEDMIASFMAFIEAQAATNKARVTAFTAKYKTCRTYINKMINILYESYPTSVTIDNKVYQILTDFRDWISFSEMISDTSVSKEDKLLFMLSWFPGEKPPVTAEMIKQLVSFFAVKEDISADVTENYSGRQKHPSFSFKYDAAYVLSDFLRYYQINLSHIEYLHWWEFQSLFKGLPDESQTKKRISYRTTNLEEISDKKERKRIRKIKLALRLPSTEIDDEDIGAVFSSCM